MTKKMISHALKISPYSCQNTRRRGVSLLARMLSYTGSSPFMRGMDPNKYLRFQ